MACWEVCLFYKLSVCACVSCFLCVFMLVFVCVCVCVCVLVGRRPACVLSGKCVQSSGRSTPSCN